MQYSQKKGDREVDEENEGERKKKKEGGEEAGQEEEEKRERPECRSHREHKYFKVPRPRTESIFRDFQE